MADAATLPIAESIRDRLPASQEPTGPSPALVGEPPETPAESAGVGTGAGLTPLGRIAESLGEAKQAYGGANQRLMDALAAGAVQTAQTTAQYEQAMQQRQHDQAARPLLPPMPPPPPRELHEFLSPVEGESPTASITKLINAIGLFAAGAGGLAKGDARGALAALTGALKGWQEGDKERADVQFANWENANKAAIQKWGMERQSYLDLMNDTNLTMEQIFSLWKIKAAQNQNDIAANMAETGSLEKMIGWLHEEQKTAVHLEERMTALLQAKQQFDERMAQRRDEMERNEALKREFLASQEMFKQQHADLMRQGQAMTERIAMMNLEERRLGREQKAMELAQGKPTPEGATEKMIGFARMRDSMAEIGRLVGQPDVRLEKIMGGIAPAINEAIQTGKMGPIPIPKGMAGSLSENENRLLALVGDLGSLTMNQRAGLAVTPIEERRILTFLMDPRVQPDVFLSRLKLGQDQVAASTNYWTNALQSGGHRAPVIPPVNLQHGGYGATPSADQGKR